MRRKKKIVEDKRIGSRRALVYEGKHFYYTNSEEKRFAERKIIAWKALQGDKK
jgi:hypothetical protein